MAFLRFKLIREGSVNLKDDKPNWYGGFPLLDLVDESALLMMQISGVQYAHNFVTINAPNQAALDGLDTDDAIAVLEDKFVGKILPCDATNWSMAHFRVKAELQSPFSTLGVHSRNASGGTSGNPDDFKICRVYLLYPASA